MRGVRGVGGERGEREWNGDHIPSDLVFFSFSLPERRTNSTWNDSGKHKNGIPPHFFFLSFPFVFSFFLTTFFY